MYLLRVPYKRHALYPYIGITIIINLIMLWTLRQCIFIFIHKSGDVSDALRLYYIRIDPKRVVGGSFFRLVRVLFATVGVINALFLILYTRRRHAPPCHRGCGSGTKNIRLDARSSRPFVPRARKENASQTNNITIAS